MLALIEAIFWQVVLWTLICGAAVNVFIRIQLYLADPGREEFINEWFEAFEAHQMSRYRAGGLAWRVRDLSMHWNSPEDTGSGKG